MHTLESEIILIETKKINKYKYFLLNLIPYTSVQYVIDCFDNDVHVKCITGLLEGQEYLDWKTDDYLDNFIKAKVISSQ